MFTCNACPYVGVGIYITGPYLSLTSIQYFNPLPRPYPLPPMGGGGVSLSIPYLTKSLDVLFIILSSFSLTNAHFDAFLFYQR